MLQREIMTRIVDAGAHTCTRCNYTNKGRTDGFTAIVETEDGEVLCSPCLSQMYGGAYNALKDRKFRFLEAKNAETGDTYEESR